MGSVGLKTGSGPEQSKCKYTIISRQCMVFTLICWRLDLCTTWLLTMIAIDLVTISINFNQFLNDELLTEASDGGG